jgi:hypothetical protein
VGLPDVEFGAQLAWGLDGQQVRMLDLEVAEQRLDPRLVGGLSG